tara:strand:- start:2932 stop:3351 length:420 start_codon:yes stop_codon:yes gene_type:complete
MTEVNILLIDDDPDDREFFEIALKRTARPINTTYACNGIKGLECLSQSACKPDYIFLDLNMPLLSGKDFLFKIRQAHEYESIPVIILSTSSHIDDIEECKRLGASHFMTKITSVEKLADFIATIISSSNLPFLLNSSSI